MVAISFIRLSAGYWAWGIDGIGYDASSRLCVAKKSAIDAMYRLDQVKWNAANLR